MAITAKSAAESAINYYEEIFNEKIKLSIEEIELDDEGFWLITLGIPEPLSIGTIGNMEHRAKAYKVFKVNMDDGQVKSMKIRKI